MAYKCDKCGGSGFIERFGHVAQGQCFKCEGTGRLAYNPAARGHVELDENLYTREEIDRYQSIESAGERRWADCVMNHEWC